MITLITSDTDLQVSEIEDLMDVYDTENVFASRRRYIKNFYIHFIKLINCGQIMTFRNIEDGQLKGYCSWIIIDKKGKQQINKVKWILPDKINEGNIFYIPSCLVTASFMIFNIRENLTARFKHKVNKAMWFNVQRGRFFTKKIKGEQPCLTAALTP